MRCRRATLDATNVQPCGVKLDLIPAKVNQFGRPQAMPEGNSGLWWRRDGRGGSAAPRPSALDLGLGQIFTGAQFGIRALRQPRVALPGRIRQRCIYICIYIVVTGRRNVIICHHRRPWRSTPTRPATASRRSPAPPSRSTSGFNPTLTIQALAYMSADAIVNRYTKSPGPLL